jgi:hypothetical protein
VARYEGAAICLSGPSAAQSAEDQTAPRGRPRCSMGPVLSRTSLIACSRTWTARAYRSRAHLAPARLTRQPGKCFVWWRPVGAWPLVRTLTSESWISRRMTAAADRRTARRTPARSVDAARADELTKRAVGFQLSDGMEVPLELASRFKFARQKSRLRRHGPRFVLCGQGRVLSEAISAQPSSWASPMSSPSGPRM